MPLNLIDLISLAGVNLTDFKVHFAVSANISPAPLEEFFDGKFEEWQKFQSRKNFKEPYILSLIQLKKDSWLFAGLYRSIGVEPKKVTYGGVPSFKYITEEVGGLEHLTGRAIVLCDKSYTRQSYLIGKNIQSKLVVSAIRDQRMTIGDFPGFNDVLLSYKMLCTIIREQNPSWKGALANVAGIYLIVDTTTGKQYVGSASGEQGLWQRWTDYATTGHGGNKDLKQLLKEQGKGHVDKLQWSLLEICDTSSSKDYVIGRETHWKNVLLTREFGLNNN